MSDLLQGRRSGALNNALFPTKKTANATIRLRNILDRLQDEGSSFVAMAGT